MSAGDLPKPAKKTLAAIAAAGFLVLVYASLVRPYGWFIDELYYLACARRLAFGYVDHPPLSIFILAAIRAIAGDSLLAVRVVAAATFSANVFLTGLLARELGGGRTAQTIAAVAFATGTGFLVIASFFSMNVFEVLGWTTTAFLTARALRLGEPRRFLAIGVVIGLTVLDKHTASTFATALVIGIVATNERRLLRTRWPWIGAALAFAIVLPNLVWQARNGWPSIEFYGAAQAAKNVPTSPPAAIFAQVTFIGPFAFALAITGAVSLVRAKDWRRALGIAFTLLFATMVVSGSSRPDRIAGAYPMAFAAGAIVVERIAQRRAWLFPVAIGGMIATAAAFVPVGLPLLPPARAAAYAQSLGLVPRVEKKSGSAMPQWLADRLGWEEFVTQVAEVVASLPENERSQAVVFAPDYGHAGALELFGPQQGLGLVVSDHNTYWLWSRGLQAERIPVLVAIDVGERTLRDDYEDVRTVATFHCDGCLPSRNDLAILVARHPRRSFGDSRAARKHFE